MRGSALAGPRVERIRHWSGPEHTRIVVDLSAAPRFERTTLAGPPRVVIGLPGAVLATGLAPAAVQDGRVARIVPIAAAARGGAAKIVIELAGEHPVQVFALGAAAGKPHRIVIDVKTDRGKEGTPPPVPAPPPPVPSGEPAPPAARAARPSSRPWTVVIDPGHGGADPGAKGPGGLWEKDVCLAIARALAADLGRRPGIQTHLTRNRDVFLPLRKRTRIAAERQADLFVSIHCNSSADRKARGTEVYFLSLRGASDPGAREVAMRENAADHVAGVPTGSVDDIENIVLDLMRTAALERSSDLAATLIEHLDGHRELEIRGVKQAGFDVLKTAGMPSVLVETAFLSHAREAKLLRSKEFQQRVASTLGAGIAEYLNRAAALEIPTVPAAAAEAGAAPPAAGAPATRGPGPAGS
jgi:N-acetylmuramoyl-L-alanine amidase